jgi:hypothetical protein
MQRSTIPRIMLLLSLSLALVSAACADPADQPNGSASQSPPASAAGEALSVRCTVDTDCGAAQRCVRSTPYFDEVLPGGGDAGPTGGGGFNHNEAAGQFCTTPRDRCDPTAAPSGLAYCVFDANQAYWVIGGKV